MECGLLERKANQPSNFSVSTSIEKRLQCIKDTANLIPVLHSDSTTTITNFDLCLNIVDRLIDFTDFESTVVDRVCGKGNFLLAAIYRFVENGADIKHVVNNIIYGYDISESQIDKCRRFIKLATGIDPKNIQVKDTLNMTVKKSFTYEVGNYPFNDSSEETGRSTDKLKENTGDLDYKFYSSNQIAEKRAVIMRAACLSKNTKVREQMFTDPSVHTFMNTSEYFDIIPDTMAVFSSNEKQTITKKFIDVNNQEWYYDTDKETKLSIGIEAAVIETLKKCFSEAKKSNFKSLWNRNSIKRSDKGVNTNQGRDFVETTGVNQQPLTVVKYDGKIDNIKHLEKYKVITNTNATGKWVIGTTKVCDPNILLSNSIVYFPFESKEEAEMQKLYLDSDYVKFIAKYMHVTLSNSSEFFEFVPYYKNLTKEKIKELNESISNT